jgi:pimeloyl-ACP methyl ester carboxylesterase
MAKDTLTKAYADTPWGQVHYRRAGQGPRALVLLHWTPFSGRMYAPVMAELAARGFTVFAPDLLGYGRSDPRPDPWTIEGWAQSILALPFAQGPFALLGGHNGASVALEVALAAPERVSHLVLDGCPILTPELAAAFRGLAAMPRPVPAADGAHERLAWARAFGLLKEYMPDFEATPDTMDAIWAAMIDYLETDFVSSGPVAGHYDLTGRLPLVRGPLLLLGAGKDTLAASYETVTQLRPEAARHFFPGDHPIHDAARAAEYAGIVADFLGPV